MNYGKHYYQDYFDTLELSTTGQLVNTRSFRGGVKLLEAPNLVGDDQLRELGQTLGTRGLVYKEFEFETTYPGLLCGIGYHHEVNKPKDEEAVPFFQLGMYFDYSSGLPVIPGSSVKGALRAAVNEWEFLADEEGKKLIERYNLSLPEEIKSNEDLKKAFIDEVFKGLVYQKDENKKQQKRSIYARDIFFDAIPFRAEGSLLGEDYITHHPNALSDPNPVRFLRVEPGVTYQFRFILHSGALFPAEFKKELFSEIICTFGLGAKTNVGYGHFREEGSAATPDAPRPKHP